MMKQRKIQSVNDASSSDDRNKNPNEPSDHVGASASDSGSDKSTAATSGSDKENEKDEKPAERDEKELVAAN